MKWKSLSQVQVFVTPWLCSPWNSPGQSTGVGSLSLPQGIFLTQGSNPGLPHCRWILYRLSHNSSTDEAWVLFPCHVVLRRAPAQPRLNGVVGELVQLWSWSWGAAYWLMQPACALNPSTSHCCWPTWPCDLVGTVALRSWRAVPDAHSSGALCSGVRSTRAQYHTSSGFSKDAWFFLAAGMAFLKNHRGLCDHKLHVASFANICDSQIKWQDCSRLSLDLLLSLLLTWAPLRGKSISCHLLPGLEHLSHMLPPEPETCQICCFLHWGRRYRIWCLVFHLRWESLAGPWSLNP